MLSSYMNIRLLKTREFTALSCRSLSLNEISVALRPFIFEVHPDRFANNPSVQQQNEKSLQIFNGYINDLFPVSSNIRPTKNIQINLTGTDPVRIAKQALERCNLSTNHLPNLSKLVRNVAAANDFAGFGPGIRTSNIDQDLLKMYLQRKRKGPKGNDLQNALTHTRTEAIQKSREAEVTKITLKDEIDDLKWRTGAKNIVWHMDWAESHMRRCLGNVHRLIDQSNEQRRESIMNALYKNVLRFGRGSFVCCDGSIQFGADHVPEQWEQICLESSRQRSQLTNLQNAAIRLRDYLGGALIILHHQRSLSQTLQQIECLITRIKCRESLHKELEKYGADTMIEVTTSYDELAVGVDGRLNIPCNVDVGYLVSFLQENSKKAAEINKDMIRLQAEIEADKDACMRELRLRSLDWENNLPLPEVLNSIRRLRDTEDSLRELLGGMGIKFCLNPNIYVMSDGKLSVPLNWI
ncbi:unnamed protein product [Auanema sp. JU1783]|nr:unnamed protein product [Auanema sp. JU1783]